MGVLKKCVFFSFSVILSLVSTASLKSGNFLINRSVNSPYPALKESGGHLVPAHYKDLKKETVLIRSVHKAPAILLLITAPHKQDLWLHASSYHSRDARVVLI